MTTVRELLLAETYIQVSEDPKEGADQQRDTFWYKVMDVYNKEAKRLKYPNRSKNMITGKWTPMNRDVGKFNTIVCENDKHKWKNPDSTNARRNRLRVTEEDPEHFGPDALPRPDGMYRIQKSQRSSNSTASSGSNPGMFQEMLQQQYELERKMEAQIYGIQNGGASMSKFRRTHMNTRRERKCWGNSGFDYVYSEAVGNSGGGGTWRLKGKRICDFGVYAPQEGKVKQVFGIYSSFRGDMNKIQSLKKIIDRIRRRLSSWKMKMLSIGGAHVNQIRSPSIHGLGHWNILVVYTVASSRKHDGFAITSESDLKTRWIQLCSNKVKPSLLGRKEGKRVSGIIGKEQILGSDVGNDYVDDVDVMLSLFAGEEDLESIDEEGYVGQMSSDEYKNELVTGHKVFTDEVVDNVGQSKKSEKKPSEEFSQRESSMKYKRLADISDKGCEFGFTFSSFRSTTDSNNALILAG
ncbi:hypothetical protein Tco_1145348 [Tanacetum coccineum]